MNAPPAGKEKHFLAASAKDKKTIRLRFGMDFHKPFQISLQEKKHEKIFFFMR
jgi:hypothetical protein